MSAELEVIDRDLYGVRVGQRRGDAYVNATALCKAAGKQLNDYRRLGSTEEFLAELSSITGIPVIGLFQSKTGNPTLGGGTWVHPDVAVNLAQWLSPKFAVCVARWVRELMTTGHVELRPLSDDPVSTALAGVGNALAHLNRRQAAVESTVSEHDARIAALERDQPRPAPVRRENPTDARRRVESAVDCPARRAEFEEAAPRLGGVQRAMALLLRVSKGLIAKVLKDKGLKVTRPAKDRPAAIVPRE